MKIGYFCNMTNWSHKPYNVLLDEVRDIGVHCDEHGWDSIWFTEHHLNHEGMDACPNPLLMGADLAARTKQIRLGQAANIIPFWNPIRVAEDIAILDHMSEGRLDVGLGRGVYGREAIHMNPEADLKDQKRVLPCAANVESAYGLKNMYVGVPTVIGAGGIEKVVEIKMNKEEQAMFDKSVDAVKGLVEACKSIDDSLA